MLKVTDVAFAFNETSVSMLLLPLFPCHAFTAVLQGLVAQKARLLPLKLIVPAASITPVPT